TPAPACPSARPTDGPRQSTGAPPASHSTTRAPQTTPACASARAPHTTFHGLFPVVGRRSSTPTTRYPGRPQPAGWGLAAGLPASFDTGQYSSQSHRRTTGSGACPVTPNAAAAPTNGEKNDDGRASKTRPSPDTSAAYCWTMRLRG